MQLIIAEKPSVAQAIAKVLGITARKDGYLECGDFLVSWCIGHLVELAEAAAYGEQYAKWRYEDLPVVPAQWQFTVPVAKRGQLSVLRGLLVDKRVDTVVNACDAGREGELIFRLVYNHLRCRKPIRRLWISSMEDAAIREGLERLRPGEDYDTLYAAALCRSQADWLVGINATRLFSILYRQTLNIGRVMTPTLALLTGREDAIAGFRKEPFYTVELSLDTFKAAGERMQDRQIAQESLANCEGLPATVLTVDTRESGTRPPQLYDLTGLQRDANRLLGYTAQQTLDYTQSLYEKKLATYPRTDSRFLTEDMAGGIPALVELAAGIVPGLGGQTSLVIHGSQVVDGSRVSDHHAIIPTKAVRHADLEALPAGERAILQLLAVRLICAVGDPHVCAETTATLQCGDNTFTAKGKTILQDGWKGVERLFLATLKGPEPEDTPEDGAGITQILPPLTKGQELGVGSVSLREGFTSPPRHHTEDSLLAAMASAGHASALEPAAASEMAGSQEAPEDAEHKGLGTPATRAATLEKLVRTGLVERKKRQLLPTAKGSALIAALPDAIKSPQLTAEWEHRLTQVERGELADDEFLEEITAMVQELVQANTAPDPAHVDRLSPAPGKETGPCPRCGGTVREGKKGFFCDNRDCRFTLWRDNKFFAAKKKTLDHKTAAALLTKGRVFASGLWSEKTGKTYDAIIVLEDTGKYVNFKLEFGSGEK